MNNFSHKKIGIWGFGVVGSSALTYFDQFDCTSIQILNNTIIKSIPTSTNQVETFLQDDNTIKSFLEYNDFILASPGIKLHDYQQFAHKFISELDLFQQQSEWSTIAITGSLGKTSITHLLTTILQKMSCYAVAAGNIGYPMLSLITTTPNEPDKNFKKVVLELSSFQLQQSQSFAPDLAIITNMYPNHLDHHTNMEEYIASKCKIFTRQSDDQIALIPLELLPTLQKKHTIKKNWIFFKSCMPTPQEFEQAQNNKIYYLQNKIVYKKDENKIEPIFNLTNLPAITFDANWLVIITALDLQNINLSNLVSIAQQLDIPDHRLQKIATVNGSDFFNDSKSTVWQATVQAVNAMDNKPTKLFLGGLDKGVDRTPLIQVLAGKNVEVFAFGEQAKEIGYLCSQFKVTHTIHVTLDESLQACIHSIKQPSNILFSPGGSSYDLFDNYIHRGQYFTKLIQNHYQIKA
jgi:UDP-N-acetylmuramoylalanine--D-glutamate ligase